MNHQDQSSTYKTISNHGKSVHYCQASSDDQDTVLRLRGAGSINSITPNDKLVRNSGPFCERLHQVHDDRSRCVPFVHQILSTGEGPQSKRIHPDES